MYRILSKEEMDHMTPNAVSYIYSAMMDPRCCPDTIEKTLIHVGLISRIEHCRIDEEGISYLFERISEEDGTVLIECDGQNTEASHIIRWEV